MDGDLSKHLDKPECLYLESLVGKTVDFDFGGTKPLRIKVESVCQKRWPWVDDEGHIRWMYTNNIVDENGSHYTVSSSDNLQVVGE